MLRRIKIWGKQKHTGLYFQAHLEFLSWSAKGLVSYKNQEKRKRDFMNGSRNGNNLKTQKGFVSGAFTNKSQARLIPLSRPDVWGSHNLKITLYMGDHQECSTRPVSCARIVCRKTIFRVLHNKRWQCYHLLKSKLWYLELFWAIFVMLPSIKFLLIMSVSPFL